MSEAFVVGQRWISTTEPDLGLGLILEAANRRVVIAFPAVEEERTYATDHAPLSRVQFHIGDAIEVEGQGELSVREVHEHNGCYVYLSADADGEIHPVPEQLLAATIQLHSARDRLLAGQLDHPRRFQLRVATMEQRGRAMAAVGRGLLGARVELLPHQFYIARNVAARHNPRVLLADEVGLGKTIEAGLILHQQYLDERVSRVLILVPDSLVHQWLVEMRRRFNLNFSIFNEERCRDLDPYRDEADSVFFDEEGEKERERNPFESEQLIIASIDWLAGHPRRGEQLLEAGWDMLVVDEAHHLQWQENGDCSASYRLVEALCEQIAAVLLLTATPENAGIDGHFARLRLLDPARYSCLQAFREEQAGYAQVSDLILTLIDQPEAAPAHDELKDYLGGELFGRLQSQPAAHVGEAVEALLDRFGTGRSLFRNTRASVGGFPARRLHEHLLSAPVEFDAAAALDQQLRPEVVLGEDWASVDPRVAWLEKFVLQHPESRTLLICSNTDTARELELYLRLRRGIASAVFHEEMSLLERDRAAAYFADPEDGAQLLVCSEIGSEGRNFQFAEHMVMFDLPLDPDLLEQRIGRLDRIGRQGEVNIHVPVYEDSAQQGLLRWYRDAMGIFGEPCTIGSAMMQRFGESLQSALIEGGSELSALIELAAAGADALRNELHSGRNRLLELNSCRQGPAQALVAQVEQEQREQDLADYLELLADQFGLEHEDHSEHTIILRPSDHMHSDAFPSLPGEGLTGTFDRRRALSREDMAFLSWEHPLVRDAMDMVVSADFGSASVCTLQVKGLPPGSLLLEAYFNPLLQAPPALQLDRYLPAFTERLLLDTQGRNLTDKVSHERLNALCQNLKRSLVSVALRQVREPLMELLHRVEKLSADMNQRWQSQAGDSYGAARAAERQRLQALAERNPEIGDAELAIFDEETDQGQAYLNSMRLNLNAIRLAIVH